MAYADAIKIGNIQENWLFQFGFFNGDSDGNGDGGFSPVTQVDGTPNLTSSLVADTTVTEVDVDNGRVFIAGDFIKIDAEIMEIVSISTHELTVLRGVKGSSASIHGNNAQVYWQNFLPISFSDILYNDSFYYGTILNKPSIRESIDITKGSSKTSNMSINIPDFRYKGNQISEEIFGGTKKYINQEVRVFAKINNETPYQIQTLRLENISFNGKTISLSLVTKRPWDFVTIPQAKTVKNNYFPVVYGLYVPNSSVTGTETFCPSQALYPTPIEVRATQYVRGLQPQALGGGSGAEARLHFYEKEIDTFIPITKNDNSFRDAAVTDGDGHSTIADAELKRGFKTKGFKEEATSSTLFSNGENAVDSPLVATTSGTFSSVDVVSGATTEEIDSSKSLYLECPNITGTVTLGRQRFYIQHTGTITADNIQLTGSSQFKGLGTGTILNTINYATEVEPGTPEVDTILTSEDSLTLSNGQLPANYGATVRLQSNALGGSYNVNTNCKIYDARLKINAKLDFSNNKEGAYQTLENLKELYCGADGLTRSWSSGSCAEIQEAHLDLLIRFAGLTQENGSAISDPTDDDEVDGWGALDTARDGWNLRWWTYKETDLLKILEKMAYEGGFVFRYKSNGVPQYIHIPNSPTTNYTLSKEDISNIDINTLPFSDLITKRNIEYEKHPAENRYISSLTTEDTSNNIRKRWNIKEKENIEDIKLDMLVGDVGDSNCGDGNPNDSFANYYYNITGDIKLMVSCDIVNPSFYSMEVGEIVEFDENNMYPETPMGYNSATWNNLQMIVTSTNRSLGKLSITLRET
tara:strand:+ start:6482 stop:8911 length:2430 start_codon:yes stop_codon:yes gene_type:complete